MPKGPAVLYTPPVGTVLGFFWDDHLRPQNCWDGSNIITTLARQSFMNSELLKIDISLENTEFL